MADRLGGSDIDEDRASTRHGPAPTRWSRLADRGGLGRYAAVGLGVAAVYFALASALSAGAGLDLQTSSWIAYLAAVVLQHIGHSLITFGTDLLERRRIVRFAVLIATGSLASATVVWLGERIGLPSSAVFVAVMAAAVALNFVALTLWVYVADAPARTAGGRAR